MKRGFTLIEVLVTIAVISILAGMMVPAVYRWWESQEEQTTLERLNALKLAMVGDRSLVQNGIRTSYGFVGDNGELPFGNMTARGGLKFLVDRPPSAYPHWNGPYLGSFEPNTYTTDAWGRTFRYTVNKDLHDRYVSGEIRSSGINGQFGDADDIYVSISEREVAPTARVQGNFVFRNLTAAGPYSARFDMKYRDPAAGGESLASSGCKQTFPNFTTLSRSDGVPLKLPLGKVSFSTKVYKSADCTGTLRQSGELEYFVSDSISSIYVILNTYDPY